MSLANFRSYDWCGWRGSNPRPLASEANTLSTELQPRRCEVIGSFQGTETDSTSGL